MSKPAAAFHEAVLGLRPLDLRLTLPLNATSRGASGLYLWLGNKNGVPGLGFETGLVVELRGLIKVLDSALLLKSPLVA